MEEPTSPYSYHEEETAYSDDDGISEYAGESVKLRTCIVSRYADIGDYMDLLGDKKYHIISIVLLTFVE